MKLPRTVLVLCCALAVPVSAMLSGCGSRAGARPVSSPEASLPMVDTTRVVAHSLNVTVPLPGELKPYEAVAIYPKVSGFVQWIGVDRGSWVHKGQLLAVLTSPELISRKAEAQAKLQSAQSRSAEAEAKTAADQATYERLKAAAATPGVISENELQIAEQAAAGDRARASALRQNADAARATLKSVGEVAGYLRIAAPFDGVVTSRNADPGALVGPGGGSSAPMLNISQVSHLRLVVAVPAMSVAYVSPGAQVDFTVTSYPDRTFHAKIARVAHALDEKTRSMPVELDAENSAGHLDPGMYAQVMWPERHEQPTLFVPSSSVVRSMEGTFVIRVRNGITDWVPVKTGIASGEQLEVFGDLAAGDTVALRGTEELHSGVRVATEPAAIPTGNL